MLPADSKACCEFCRTSSIVIGTGVGVGVGSGIAVASGATVVAGVGNATVGVSLPPQEKMPTPKRVVADNIAATAETDLMDVKLMGQNNP